MSSYRIMSDKTTFGPAGTIVSENDLASVNIDALVAGGHISPAKAETTETTTKPKGKGSKSNGEAGSD